MLFNVFIVVDPVMVSTSGSKLIDDIALHKLKSEPLPIATVITPNIYEGEILCNRRIKSKEDMFQCAENLNNKYGYSVLIKGGHSSDDADDLLYSNNSVKWFKSKRIDNNNTHGTGCTLSSAIATNLAKGLNLEDSIEESKEYITKALSMKLNLGKGSGPLDHTLSYRE